MRIEQQQKWIVKTTGHLAFDAPETALEPSSEVAKLAVQVLPYDGQEHLFALAMDVHGVPLSCAKVATGSVDNCPLFARDLFAWGVTVPRARFLGVAHNHPSGNVTPSGPDASGTALLMKLGQMMGLDVVWSLVVTHEGPQWEAIKPKGQPKPKDGEQEPYQPKDPDDEPEGKPEPDPDGEPEQDGTPNDSPDDEGEGEGEQDSDKDESDEQDGEPDKDGDDGDDTPEDEPEPAPEEDHKDDTGHSEGHAKKAPEASVDDLRAAIVAAFGLKQ